MFVLRIVSQLVTFATIIIISRTLGPDEFGRYSFLYGFLIIFTLFNVNGLNDILVRDIASQPDRRDVIYRNGLALKLIAGIFAFVLACIVILVFNISTLPKWICCIAALTILVSFSMGSFRLVWDVPYQVDFRMTSTSIINLSGRMLFFVLLLIWLVKSYGNEITGFTGLRIEIFEISVLAVILLQTFSEITATAIQGGLNLKFGYRMLPRWDADTIKYLLKEVWPLAIVSGLIMVYYRINIPILQYFMTDHDVGLYAAPMRLTDALLIIPTVYIAVATPILSVTRRKASEFLSLITLSYRYMLLLSLAVAAVVVTYNQSIIRLFFGSEYLESAPILAILSIASVLIFSSMILSTTLIVTGEQKLLMIISSIQTVLSIGLNALLIHWYGIQGAAWATVITFGSMFILVLFYKNINYTVRVWFRLLPVPLFCAVVTGFILKITGLGLLPAVILGPVIFFALNIVLGGIKREDIRMGGRIISSRATDYYSSEFENKKG